MFMLIYLLSSFKNFFSIILPFFYFICLGSSFAVHLLPLAEAQISFKFVLRSFFVMTENMLPEASFLLIMQCLLGRVPPWPYFLILTLPIIGAGSFTYLFLNYKEVCIPNYSCFYTSYLMNLYHVFGTALVFLLLMVTISRKSHAIDSADINKKSKYWLIIALVMFNLITISTYLAEILLKVPKPDALFIRTMIGIVFIYLVLSSIFRVFSKSFQLESLQRIWIPTDKEKNLAAKIENMLMKENIYRQVGFSRKQLAQKLKVNEHTLSKVMNWKFKKSFRELTNELRMKEAKEMLRETKKSITTIAVDTGFTSITSFNRVFKEYTGKSATEFRQNGGKKKKAS